VRMRYNKDEAAMRIRNNEDAGAVGWSKWSM
jgi:hypothetical protein